MTGTAGLSLPQEEGDSQTHQNFKGVSKIVGPQWSHLPALTIGLLGVSIFWSVEMSYASPYLLSLGLSKSKMAVVFVAGPLSGLVMQPLIGLLADNCTSRFGRRRPYMMIGTAICMFAMVLLGFTRWFASIFTGRNTHSNDLLTIWLAVFAIYFIDFSINAIMAVDRALLVDTLTSSRQPEGNAWAARMGTFGSIVGFFVGNVDLTKAFPFFGKTQLEVLSVVASLVLLGCHLITAIFVKEKILLPSTDITHKTSFLRQMKDMWTTALTLPRTIHQIFVIQFFAWIAWFPVLFYTTIYIGDLHRRVSPVPTTDEAQEALNAEATRLGSRALFWSSVVSFAGNVLLPLIVAESTSGTRASEQRPHLRIGYGTRGARWKRVLKVLKVPVWMKIHLASLWALGHFIFAGCMFATLITSSVAGASFLITVTGFSWAITQWAPFALLATAILTESSGDDYSTIQLSDTRTGRRVVASDIYINSDAGERNVFLPGEASDSEDDEEDETEVKEERRRMLGNSLARVSRVNVGNAGDRDRDDMANDIPEESDLGGNKSNGLSAKAGIILGIHNISIVVPQFIITGIAALIFAIFDPENASTLIHHKALVQGQTPVTNGTDRQAFPTNATESFARAVRSVAVNLLQIRQEIDDSPEVYKGSNSVVYIFRFGGISALIAAVLAWRLARDLRHR